jgi:hypothetical protein
MNVYQEYLSHIEKLKKRIETKETIRNNLVPKDLFLMLKFGNYTKLSGNIIQLKPEPS